MTRTETMRQARVGRASHTLLIGLLLLAFTVTTAAPAAAHNYGHECGQRVASNGFSCRLTSPTGSIRQIATYYNGTLRGSASASSGGGPGGAFSLCDNNANDTIDPRVRLEDTNGVIHEYNSSEGSCLTQRVDYTIRRFRVVNRNPSGEINHGTIWYGLP